MYPTHRPHPQPAWRGIRRHIRRLLGKEFQFLVLGPRGGEPEQNKRPETTLWMTGYRYV